MAELGCKSLLDVACGDFHWMRHLELDADYIGCDIVDELVAENQRLHESPRRKFVCLDLLQDELPRADLALCRDCLVHFSNRHVFQALLIERRVNQDIPTGAWRPLNLQMPPFNLPPPRQLIDEECDSEGYRDRHLGLWNLADVPDFA